MKGLLIKALLPVLVKIVEEMVTTDAIKIHGDKLFDLIEDYVKDTKNQYDDAFILPIVKKLRGTLNIPDLPDN